VETFFHLETAGKKEHAEPPASSSVALFTFRRSVPATPPHVTGGGPLSASSNPPLPVLAAAAALLGARLVVVAKIHPLRGLRPLAEGGGSKWAKGFDANGAQQAAAGTPAFAVYDSERKAARR
jgi:hypothetical protein